VRIQDEEIRSISELSSKRRLPGESGIWAEVDGSFKKSSECLVLQWGVVQGNYWLIYVN
jgi:hypothetical protein